MTKAFVFALAISALLASVDAATVQVFILMGQSNMLGMGKVVGNTTNGTLEFAVHNESKYQYLWDAEEHKWATSDTVRNVLIMGSGNASFEQSQLLHNEFMSVVGSTIGPELGIGWTLRNYTDEPIMLLKACIGDRSLGWDLLPPGSPRFDYVDPKNASHITTYAGYHDSPNNWPKGTIPKPIGWMAGEQYDGDTNRSQIILSNFSYYYPGETQYEVAGFFWWQGDKDHYDTALSERYEYNLVNIIKQLRVEFNAPNALFVTASLGQTVMCSTANDGLILDAMLDVANATLHPEFAGTVAAVYTHPLSMGGASNSHYNGNAETYMNVGQGMGAAMVGLLKGKAERNN
jgi:hypothetical protein